MEFAQFAARAMTVLFGLWEAHDRDNARALDALDENLRAQRAKNDAALKAKHMRERDDEDTKEVPVSGKPGR